MRESGMGDRGSSGDNVRVKTLLVEMTGEKEGS